MDKNICPDCSRPYSKKRKRCYSCHPGKKKTGKTVKCKQCGKPRYFQKNQLENGEGKFCSYECKYEWYRGRHRDIPIGKRVARHSRGYWFVWVGFDHPSRNKQGRMLEHRFVMEKKIGRYLKPNEVVHHINGKLDDNRPENLELMTHSDHARLHLHGKKRAKH